MATPTATHHWFEDFAALTKLRLSLFVVMTTAVGFAISAGGSLSPAWALGHALWGTTLAALGSSIYNQLMEVEVDRRMARTRGRPLPAGRISPGFAFGIGWVLCAWGIIHLGVKVNTMAAILAVLTLLTYLFVYTPLKKKSAWNTVVGAVSGAFPPLIGWAAADGIWNWIPLYLFLLLFFWQMPHFLAINWLYREEYREAGLVMWANDDPQGRRTGVLSLAFSILLIAVSWMPFVFDQGGVLRAALLTALSITLLIVALRFFRSADVKNARWLFFTSLIFLPIAMLCALV